MSTFLNSTVAVTTALCLALGALPAAAQTTQTPIKNLIVVIGENTSFDMLFANFEPAAGAKVKNLLSSGIVTADGKPGPNYAQALQKAPTSTQGKFGVDFSSTVPLKGLPRPLARDSHEGPRKVDEKIPADLPPGPFQITRYHSYQDFTDSNPVHRFFQMWQQVNGGRNDLFIWAGLSSGEGARNREDPARGTIYGGETMGFYNMAAGDVSYFRQLAREFALADNYHQAVMGGTMPNYLFLATGDVGRYNSGGKPAVPPSPQIENPDPVAGTANWYSNSSYSSGSYVNCADETQPGAAAIRRYLQSLPYGAFRNGNCEPGAYYLVNNYPSPYTLRGARKEPEAAKGPVATPQAMPSIATQLQAAGVTWKWYHGGREGNGAKKGEYSSDTDPLTFLQAVMESSLKDRLQGDAEFFADVDRGLPSVSFISPPLTKTGHPHYGSPASFEAYVKLIVEKVRSNKEVWEQTAILVTYDEGGGYYDSGYIQPVDFFGDGTRVPLIAVSRWARKGHVEHAYFDHASIHKFIQRNWGLKPLSARSRDNLPNPVHSKDAYVPDNRPAIGDLFPLFDFKS